MVRRLGKLNIPDVLIITKTCSPLSALGDIQLRDNVDGVIETSAIAGVNVERVPSGLLDFVSLGSGSQTHGTVDLPVLIGNIVGVCAGEQEAVVLHMVDGVSVGIHNIKVIGLVTQPETFVKSKLKVVTGLNIVLHGLESKSEVQFPPVPVMTFLVVRITSSVKIEGLERRGYLFGKGNCRHQDGQ
jgi:hypothetical protein